MRRSVLFALLGLLAVASFHASAASLQVDAGVLQVWTFEIDSEPSSSGTLSLDPDVVGSTTTSLCDGYEDASFCGGPSDQDER